MKIFVSFVSVGGEWLPRRESCRVRKCRSGGWDGRGSCSSKFEGAGDIVGLLLIELDERGCGREMIIAFN